MKSIICLLFFISTVVFADDANYTEMRAEMVKEVLDTMIELAGSGMTMLCVTHEMGFARSVADRVIFMDEGEIVEQGPPQEFFNNPKSDRTKLFLCQILDH